MMRRARIMLAYDSRWRHSSIEDLVHVARERHVEGCWGGGDGADPAELVRWRKWALAFCHCSREPHPPVARVEPLGKRRIGSTLEPPRRPTRVAAYVNVIRINGLVVLNRMPLEMGPCKSN